MADDPDAARDNVVPLHSKALLPHRIPAGRFADAMRALRDDLRGSLREDGVVARIAHIFERLMWVIAKGDDLKETVFPTATELALALDELDEEIAKLRERPETAADAERVAALERDLAAALEAERAERATNHTAHDEQVAALTRELEAERTARQAAERARLDEFRTAGAALRAEATSAAQAIAALTALAERAGAAHTTVETVLAAITATAETSSAPNLAATNALLTARKERLERWLRGLEDDFLRVVAEELAEIPDAQELQAMQRTGGVRVPDHIRAEVAAHVTRRQQLERYSDALIALKRPVERERDAISRVLAAIDLVSQPVPAKADLPAIPDYPELAASPTAEADDAGFPVAPPVAGPLEASDAVAPADAAPSRTVNPMAVRLAVVLFDIVTREVNATQHYTISRVMKSAEAAGILTRHGFSRFDFLLAFTTKGSWDPESDALLSYHGTRIAGNPATTTYLRTGAALPSAWAAFVTDAERTAFIEAFRTFVPTQPPQRRRTR